MGTDEKVCATVQSVRGRLLEREEILNVPHLMKGLLEKGLKDEEDLLLLQNVLLPRTRTALGTE